MILVNKNIISDGSTRVVHSNGSVSTVTSIVNRTIEFRDGTGRRPKPKPLDETPYDRTSVLSSAPYGTGTFSYPSNPNQKWSGACAAWEGALSFALQRFTLSLDENLANIARLKAQRKLNQADLDLGTAWGERAKTAQLLGDLAELSTDVLRAARKGRGRDILDMFGLSHDGPRGAGFVDAWLAYRYGIRPLVKDIQGAIDHMNRDDPAIWSVESRASEASVSTQQKQRLHVSGSVEIASKLELRARCRITASQLPLARQQDRLWSLGLDNPLSTAYEMAPYSFVLDWALPIGSWLEALNSVKYYKDWVITTSNTLREEVTSVRGTSGSTVSPSYPYYKSSYSSTLHGGSYKAFKLQRRVSRVPLPVLPVRDPRSLTHMADALSLFASRLAHGEQRRFVRY